MLKESVRQAFHWRVFDFLFGSGGSLIAFLLFYKNLTGKNSTVISIGYALLAFVVLFIIRFLYFFVKNCIIHIHKIYIDSIWGNAIVELKNVYGEIHFLARGKLGDEEFMKVMTLLCDTIAGLIKASTSANCAVSINVRLVNNDDLTGMEYKCLCYDAAHHHLNNQEENRSHSVVGNTPYCRIVNDLLNNKPHPFYYNENVHNAKDYDNTKKCYNKDGILPYKSELVLPIMPLKNTGKKTELYGFIWIESDKEKAFEYDKYSAPMVQGIADGIVDIFRVWENNHKQV